MWEWDNIFRWQSVTFWSLCEIQLMLTSCNRAGLFTNKIFFFSKFSMVSMLNGNGSTVTKFVLAGLTDYTELQMPLFYLFLTIYIVTVVGNFGLITLITLNSHLHHPMSISYPTSPSLISVTLLFSAPKCWWTLSLRIPSPRGVHDSAVSLSLFCLLWILHGDLNGLRLLCGHLKFTAV